MGRKGSILEFRKPRPRKVVMPGPVRSNKLQFAGRNRVKRVRFGVRSLLVAVAVVPVTFLAGMGYAERLAALPGDSRVANSVVSAKPAETWVSVNWVDGDSGTLDGRSFRLFGVDAPEGSATRAKCASELRQADAARDAVRELTSRSAVTVTATHGIDKYDRELVSLGIDGRDVASSLIASGHLKRWNYERGDRKPNWCGT